LSFDSWGGVGGFVVGVLEFGEQIAGGGVDHRLGGRDGVCGLAALT
jgi:hypothetical protein